MNVIEQTAKLYSELDRYEDKFSILNHELKTPLNGVVGNIELLKIETDENMKQKCIEIIDMYSKNLLNLIEENLEKFRICDEVGQYTNNKIFLMNYLIENIYNTYYIQRNETKFIFNLYNIYEAVNSDYFKIYQVITNLINNAIKFNASGRDIIISISNVNNDILFKYSTDSNYIKIDTLGKDCKEYLFVSVEDHGVGIHPENVYHIFEKYEQYTTTNNSGIGLGLFLCKKIINSMNGFIFVKSVFGEGTKFAIFMPIEVVSYTIINNQSILIDYDTPLDIKKGDIIPTMSEHKINKSITIFIADDNEMNLSIVTRMLKSLHYKTKTFENGKDIYEYCIDHNCDIIFMDIHMPVMNGYEAVTKIKQLKNHKKTFMIAYTASVFRINELKDKGFDEIINKPASINTIKQKLLNCKLYQ